MALAGVSNVYSTSNDLLKAFLGIDLSVSQVCRVTHLLGEQLSTELLQEVDHPPLAEDELIYGSIDGSMLLTDEGWQEVKPGRIFASQSRVEAGKKGDRETRFRLTESTYSGHLGTHSDFTPLFEASLGAYKTKPEQLVFITDGAVWIEQYLQQTYPKATYIVDYYHAAEHLTEFVRIHFKGTRAGGQWFDNQKEILLTDGVDSVLSALSSLTGLSDGAVHCRQMLAGYFGRNRHRMRYGHFRHRGLQIGSGPIEAAHRTVIQTRMKRSAQRWTDAGAQAMLNLRVVAKSGRWHLVRKNLNEA